MKIRHKFKNIITEVDGIKFRSKKEAKYYQELKLKQKAGIVLFFLFQIPIYLPGGVKYIVDFVEFMADENVNFVDVKGYRTPQYKTKKKLVEALYPFKIIEK